MQPSAAALILFLSGILYQSAAYSTDLDMVANIEEGQRVASEIDDFLSNERPRPERAAVRSEVDNLISTYHTACADRRKRSTAGIGCDKICCKVVVPPGTGSETYITSYSCKKSRTSYYTTSCGLFWWGRCRRSRTRYGQGACYRQATRYYAITRSCPSTQKTCCIGYIFYRNYCIDIARLRQILGMIERRSRDPCVSGDTVSLIGSWRKDKSGSQIKPIDGQFACDRELQTNSSWFRFAGAAGTQLLNTCPADYSCGSHGGFWSDAAMPSRVGEVRHVQIHGRFAEGCSWYDWPTRNALTVKRCSKERGDFVYKVYGSARCAYAFCGRD